MLDERRRSFLRWWWGLWLTTMMLLGIVYDPSRLHYAWAVYSRISSGVLVQNCGIILTIAVCASLLLRSVPLLRWNWFRLFARNTVGESEAKGENINVMPLQLPILGWLFGLVFLTQIPTLAHWEEQVFRAGLETWNDALPICFLFGMMHCLAGVPLGVGVALTIGGIWFSHQYMQGGLELSTLHHTTYNAIILSVILLGMIPVALSKLFKNVQRT